MRFGAKVENFGSEVTMERVLERGRIAEEAGFDSVWLSDHIAMPLTSDSRYPYANDGKISWQLDEPWLDPVTLLSALAAVTTRLRLGVAVMLVNLREPINLAKQLACVEQLAPGRLTLGVGDGWLKEELALFQVSFSDRRVRTDEHLRLMEEVWSGSISTTGAHSTSSTSYSVKPVPGQPIDVFIGGQSPAVFARIAKSGYGWLPLPGADHTLDVVRRGVETIEQMKRATLATSTPEKVRVIVNAGSIESIAHILPELEALGVEEVLVEASFDEFDGPEKVLAIARTALA
ncbi:MAG TPA: TIGR03619 family F420-dependent LLM class oxidoreductase [Acidimicrobiales bacterium]|nr:TIGR03619 family F420-dependent LLM class oxidoreductase [Acidimicrobiales bacterium]